MTQREEIDRYFRELQETITWAALNYEIWWVYKSPDTPDEYKQSMRRYNQFFFTSIYAHFVVLVITLYSLYENKSKTCNIPNFLVMFQEGGDIPATVITQLCELREGATPIWDKVKILRNRVFGHRSTTHTFEELFEMAKITPSELKHLIELTQTLLDKVMLARNDGAHDFNVRTKSETIRLLNDITILHQLDSQEKASIRLLLLKTFRAISRVFLSLFR